MALIYALIATALISLGIGTSMTYFESFLLSLQENRISLENTRIAERFAEGLEEAYNIKLQVGMAACPSGHVSFPAPPDPVPTAFCIPPAGMQTTTVLRNGGAVNLDTTTSRVIVLQFEGKTFPVYVFELQSSESIVASGFISQAFAQWEKVPRFSGVQPTFTVDPGTCAANPEICRRCAVDICVQIRFCSAELSPGSQACVNRTKIVIQDIVIRKDAGYF